MHEDDPIVLPLLFSACLVLWTGCPRMKPHPENLVCYFQLPAIMCNGSCFSNLALFGQEIGIDSLNCQSVRIVFLAGTFSRSFSEYSRFPIQRRSEISTIGCIAFRAYWVPLSRFLRFRSLKPREIKNYMRHFRDDAPF